MTAEAEARQAKPREAARLAALAEAAKKGVVPTVVPEPVVEESSAESDRADTRRVNGRSGKQLLQENLFQGRPGRDTQQAFQFFS